jgi:PAS domain S-box-containing protein
MIVVDPHDAVIEENRALRQRVSVLQHQLQQLQKELDSLGGGQDPREKAAERAIAGFFEQPLVMLFIADLVEGRFLRVNQKVCDVLGFSRQELFESSFLDRVHPDDRRLTMLEMERLVAGAPTVGFRNRHLAADGTYRTFEWTAVADTDRELCYAMAIEVGD